MSDLKKNTSNSTLNFDLCLDDFINYLEIKGRTKNTIISYKRDLTRYISFIQNVEITEIDQIEHKTISDHLHTLKTQGLTASTIARNLTSIKSFHRFAVLKKFGRHDPSDLIEAPKFTRKKPNLLDLNQISLLMATADQTDPLGMRDLAILELLYATGIRVSELIDLRQESLDLKRGTIYVSGKHPRHIPLGKPAIRVLQIYLRSGRIHHVNVNNSSVDNVFLNVQGGHLSRMSIWKITTKAGRKAKINNDVSPHTLRHCFAVHLLEGGASLGDVQQLLGHSSISTTQMYAQHNIAQIKRVHETYHPRS